MMDNSVLNFGLNLISSYNTPMNNVIIDANNNISPVILAEYWGQPGSNWTGIYF